MKPTHRPFLFVMDNAIIEATPRSQGRPSQDIYLDNGRFKQVAERASQFKDASVLNLLDSCVGFGKLVHSIGITVQPLQADCGNVCFRMQSRGADVDFLFPCPANGIEAIITLAKFAWPQSTAELSLFAFVFDAPGTLARASIKLYLQDGFTVPAIAAELAVDFQAPAYQRMIEKSLLHTGNVARLQAAFARSENGDAVTVAYIGGSITQGAGAKPIHEACYARLSFQHLQSMLGKSNSNLRFIKAGVGGTPSELGMIRFEKDVLRNGTVMPDIVIVEFAVNDDGDETLGAAYESLCLRALRLPNKPAVVLLFSVFYNDWNLQDRLAPIGLHYDLPMVSIKDAVTEQFTHSKQDGNVISKKQYFYDGFHPSNDGHRVMADCLAHLFATVRQAAPCLQDIPLDKQPLIGNQFADIQCFDRSCPACEGVHITAGGFAATDTELQMVEMDARPVPTAEFPHNWMHTAASGSESLVLQVHSRNLLVVCKDSGDAAFGKAELWLDGAHYKTIDPHQNGWTHCNAVLVYDNPFPARHRLEIKMATGEAQKNFTVLGFGFTG